MVDIHKVLHSQLSKNQENWGRKGDGDSPNCMCLWEVYRRFLEQWNETVMQSGVRILGKTTLKSSLILLFAKLCQHLLCHYYCLNGLIHDCDMCLSQELATYGVNLEMTGSQTLASYKSHDFLHIATCLFSCFLRATSLLAACSFY